jgi:acylphosphatase
VSATRRARHAIVFGRVQGVGFRFAAEREARHRGLAGWVTNRSDGAVEVHYEGASPLVADFEEWLARGPIAARVERVEARDAEPQGHTVFEVRR